MKLNFTTLDVFTTSPLSGNPVAVLEVPSELRSQLTEDVKGKIALEFNLSEIVFLHEARPEDEQTEYDIFTPKSRIAFAGHPTIGTAIYLMTVARQRFPAVTTLRTLAGEIPIEFDADSKRATVGVPHCLRVHEKRLPHPLPDPSTNPSGADNVPAVSIVKGMAFNLVPLSDLDALGSVSTGLLPVTEVYKSEHLDKHDGWNKGVHGTLYYVDLNGPTAEQMHGEPGARVLRTRSIGWREDPGTGSASSALASYLSLQEPKQLGPGPFLFHLVQGVEMGKRCDIYVSVRRTKDGSAVEHISLSGSAVKVMEGTLEFEL